MKIIIFTENNRRGGVDTFIASLVNHWPIKEDKFIIISNKSYPGLQYISESLKDECDIITHDIPLNWSFLSSYIRYLPNLLQRIFRQLFRIILSPFQYYALKKLLRTADGDYLISVNGGYPGGETCRLATIAWASMGMPPSIHNFHNLAAGPRKIFTPYESYIDKQLEESAKQIITVSKYCLESLFIRPVFKKSSKLSFIYNGLPKLDNSEHDSGKLRTKLNITQDEKLILMIGTYEKRKGHEFLMQSMTSVFKKYPQLHLVIIGTGTNNEKSNIKSIINRHGSGKNIHLMGFVDNAASMIKEADLLVIPSQADESFGLTAVEAMLSCVPVVSTNIGALPETLGENGNCGFYSPPNRPDLFSENIICLIDNHEKSKELGLNGKKRAHKYYDPKLMADNYSKILK